MRRAGCWWVGGGKNVEETDGLFGTKCTKQMLVTTMDSRIKISSDGCKAKQGRYMYHSRVVLERCDCGSHN